MLYLAAGTNYFINQSFYKKIIPPWLGWNDALIFIIGVAEILLALLYSLHPPSV
ncbi:MAG: hypothetical protein LH619_07335 [Chitinophagaceae bacterium]|nr:hypothetical protein [Chitinophagaceae bacterium]